MTDATSMKISTLTERRIKFLNEMGVAPLWRTREWESEQQAANLTPAFAASEAELENNVQNPTQQSIPQPQSLIEQKPIEQKLIEQKINEDELDWNTLQSVVASCTRCGLCAGRKQTVFGVGDARAKWLFVGEGPGRNEDLQGEPFVGVAGKLLDNMLLAMDLKRGANTFIANIVKCRPTGADGRDRPPTEEEITACMPYLERQIALIQPSIIIALGKTAAVSLLKRDYNTPVSRLRGAVHRYAAGYAELPLIVTYHPAYLLRNLVDKSKVWEDLVLALANQRQ